MLLSSELDSDPGTPGSLGSIGIDFLPNRNSTNCSPVLTDGKQWAWNSTSGSLPSITPASKPKICGSVWSVHIGEASIRYEETLFGWLFKNA